MRGQELTVEEREVVSRELAAGQTGRGIARVLGRHHSVVNREIKRNGGAAGYRAVPAQRRAERHRTRPKPHRLMASLTGDRRLHDEVNAGLAQKWSPRQISRRLREDFPAEDTMRVSHETIYQCLYLQAKGQLRTELALALRQGRTHRVPWTRPAVARGTIPRMVPISDRPAEADDRAVPGFWEGDLIIGKGGKSQIATLVERVTRFVMLVRVPHDRTAERVAIQLSLKMQTLPDFMKNSVTWDQGKEMAAHEKFSIATGMPVYFRDPHSPWQRGSNENTNGFLRQYFPKGTDLSGYSQADLDAVAAELNGRPRETLQWRKPVEVFNDLLVNATAH